MITGEAGLRYFLLSGRFLINSHLADHKLPYCNKLILCFSNPLPTVGGSEEERGLQAGNSLHLIVLTDQKPSLHSRGMSIILLLYITYDI